MGSMVLVLCNLYCWDQGHSEKLLAILIQEWHGMCQWY